MRGMLSLSCSKKLDVEDIGELRSMGPSTPAYLKAEGRKERLLFPSPLTPAYLKAGDIKRKVKDDEEVDGACRSFENYLVQMVVEDGKVRDLTDVEELLYCWKNLKCPVFRNLVCRFYGELCKDLFLGQDEE